MGCGCGRKNSYGAANKRRRTTLTPSRTAVSRSVAKGAAAAVKAQNVVSPSTQTSDKKRIDKIRRQAILRALGKL